VIDRFSFRALALVYFGATFAVAAIGQLGHSALLVSIAIFAAGFCVVGGQIAANALTAGYYPTSVRATGVGWALGIGRVGSIIGPLVGGLLLAGKWSTSAVFMSAAAAALCAAVAALALSRIAGTVGQTSSGDATLKAATTGGT
jgi:AAHS family 4-hydroxybenzoate transporter-like MFS transporter